MLFFRSSHVVADGHNRLSTQNWWCASRQLATCQQLVDPRLLGIHKARKYWVLAGRWGLEVGLVRGGAQESAVPG
jgi:hypothetical protein